MDLPELSGEIFAHILNKTLNHQLAGPKMVFIDGTHIKAPGNKKKYQKKQAARTAKAYGQQLREEAAAEREKLGKKNDDGEAADGSGGGTVRKTVSTTGPECGMFAKGGHERQSACEAHTACDRHGWILGVE